MRRWQIRYENLVCIQNNIDEKKRCQVTFLGCFLGAAFLLTPGKILCIFFIIDLLGDRSTVGQRTLTP